MVLYLVNFFFKMSDWKLAAKAVVLLRSELDIATC